MTDLIERAEVLRIIREWHVWTAERKGPVDAGVVCSSIAQNVRALPEAPPQTQDQET